MKPRPSTVQKVGLEPTQPQWPKDFKSFVSTIPPFLLLSKRRTNAGTLAAHDISATKLILFSHSAKNIFHINRFSSDINLI